MKKEDPSTFYLPIPDGIATIENYINNTVHNEIGRDLTWMSGIVYKTSGIQCYSIKQIVPINIFESIVNTLKMLLMKIFIKLDKTYGCLDDLDIETTTIDKQKIDETNTVINQYIHIDSSIKIGDKNKIENSNILGEKTDG